MVATVGFLVNPSESEAGVRATFEGLQACFFGLFQKPHVCANTNCDFAEISWIFLTEKK